MELKDIKVGMPVFFKADIEQGGTVKAIRKVGYYNTVVVVQAPEGGFEGEYLRGQETAEFRPEDLHAD